MSTRPRTNAGVDPEAQSGSGPQSIAPDRAEAPAPPRAIPGEQSLEEAPCWPVTRLGAWSLTVVLAAGLFLPAAAGSKTILGWVVFVIPTIVAVLGARGLFETVGILVAGRSRLRRFAAALPATILGVAIVGLATVVLGNRLTVGEVLASTTITLLTLWAAGMARELEIRLRLSLRRVFFVGSPGSRSDLERELSLRSDARFVGTADIGDGFGEEFIRRVLATRATVLVADGNAMRATELVEAAARLNLMGLHVRDLVSYYESEFKKVPLSELSPTWFLFDIADIHHRRPYRIIRHAIDIATAALLLVVSLPLLLVSVVLIRLTSGGPALYRQARVGRDGQEFVLLKLRTMRGAEAHEASWASSELHRVTSVGRVLRRSRLDELPQLWNVIRGELALIGPRPEQVPIARRLDRELVYYSARHCIRPGITGWAQVNLGYAGSMEGAVAKLQRDLFYIKHNNLRLDALIAWLTFKAVLLGPGTRPVPNGTPAPEDQPYSKA